MFMRIVTEPKKGMKMNYSKQMRGNEGEKQSFLSVIFASFQKKDLSVLKVVPYKKIDSKTGILIDRRNIYQAYLKVQTTDLLNMNYDDLKQHMSQLTSLCRNYHEPFKILSLTYSTETTEQQGYWKRIAISHQRRLNEEKLDYAQEQIIYNRLTLANEHLNRFLWVEKNLKELAFFVVVYGKNEKEIQKNVTDVIRYGGRNLNLRKLPVKEVEKLVFKLQNKNSEM